MSERSSKRRRRNKVSSSSGATVGKKDANLNVDLSNLISSSSPSLVTTGISRIEKIASMAWNAVSFDSLPEWLRDNEFLHYHHRPPMYSIRGCIKSTFRMHTETWNIWTHLVGFIFFATLTLSVYCFRDYITFLFESNIVISDLPWQEQLVIFLFFLGAMTCLFCSTIFHMLGNHSQAAHAILSRCDYTGIAILITGSSIPCYYYFFYCRQLARHVHTVISTLLCIMCICVSLWSKFSTPKYRPLRFGLFVAFGLYAIVPGLDLFINGGLLKLPYSSYILGIVMMGTLYLVGASLYVLRVPERFFPGKFDIWAHSHQIFHVCVLLAALVHYDNLLSMVRDRLILGEECDPRNSARILLLS